MINYTSIEKGKREWHAPYGEIYVPSSQIQKSKMTIN
jgi:hypothetical protein